MTEQLPEAITIVVCLLMALVTLPLLYFYKRNFAVYKFRIEVTNLVSRKAKAKIHNGDEDWERPYELISIGPSYRSMVYSFKPLKIESWYDQETIEYLNSP